MRLRWLVGGETVLTSSVTLMNRTKAFVGIAVLAVGLVACEGGLDSDEASAIFADCLERNGIEAQNVEVTISDGTVEDISLGILSEGEIPYEPVVRLQCTDEVEGQ
jgi:hypothetical protein